MFLDTAHPAGFPLFSQLSNLASFIPLGPLTWRVNLFSSFVVSMLLTLAALIAVKISEERKLSPPYQITLLLFVLIGALKSASIFGAGIEVEAYGLNTLLILSSVGLFLIYKENKDPRLIYLNAFGSGLAAGNHVAFILFIVLSAPAWFAIKKPTAGIVISAITCFLVGLSVYGAIPARAVAGGPLNTGGVDSFKRFFYQISDARDPALRPASPVKATGNPFVKRITQFGADVVRLQRDLPWIYVLLALVGIIGCLSWNRLALYILSAVVISNLLFFSGWDSEPWVSSATVILILSAVGLISIFKWLEYYLPSIPFLGATSLIALTILTIASSKRTSDEISSAEVAGMELLKAAERHAPYMVEPSWFVARYLTAVEGFRDDVKLIYQPALLFPEYFSPVILGDSKSKKIFNSREITSNENFQPNAPEIRNIGRAISFLSSYPKVYLEANRLIAAPLREVLRTTDSGQLVLEPGKDSNLSSKYAEARETFIKELFSVAAFSGEQLQQDTLNYLEAVTTNEAAVMEETGSPGSGLKLLTTVCSLPIRCSLKSRLHLASLQMQSNAPCEALSTADCDKDSSAGKYPELCDEIAAACHAQKAGQPSK